MALDSTEELKDDGRVKDVLASFDSASGCMTINDTMLGVKKEPEDSTENLSDGDLFKEHAHQETIDTLSKDPRKVLRNIGDCITNAKFAFAQAEKHQYTQKLASDLKGCLNKMTAAFKQVESFVLVHREDSSSLDTTLVEAMAEMVDKALETYNGLWEWSEKFFDMKEDSRKRKRA